MNASHRDYDPLASLYNRYWGREYPALALRVLDLLLLPGLAERARVLDLCCGAGHLTGILSARHFRMTGIDGSPSMLTYARWNAPAADFIAADARDFRFRLGFQAVISTFESMNHILSEDELLRVFSNVGAVLAPGGTFLFDLLTEEAYRTEWIKTSAIVEQDSVCVMRGEYEPSSSLASVHITAFQLSGGIWKRADATVRERCYSADAVRSMLEKADFSQIEVHDASSLAMTGSLAVGRKFVTAKNRRTI